MKKQAFNTMKIFSFAFLLIVLGFASNLNAQLLSPGSIAFTAFIWNGNSQFAFAPTSSLTNGQIIYFTDESYDATIPGLVAENATLASGQTPVTESDGVVVSDATTVSENIISYTVGSSGLNAYTQVVIGNSGSSLQGGTVAGVPIAPAYLTLNHNGTGHKILAFTVSGAVTQYVAGLMFGPDTWYQNVSLNTGGNNPIPAGYFWDSYLPPGLNASNSTDLSTLWNSQNFNQFDTDLLQNDNAAVTCENSTSGLAGIVWPWNWLADGNESKGSLEIGSTLKGATACTTGYVGLASIPSELVDLAATYTPTVSGSTSTLTNTPTNTATLAQTATPTNSPTTTPTATYTPVPSTLTPGSVGIIGFVRDGASQIAFVNSGSTTWNKGTVLYFTNECYDGSIHGLVDESVSISSSSTATEGVISYTVGSSGLAPYVPIIIGASGDALAGGTIATVSGTNSKSYLTLNKNGLGDKLIAFQSTVATPGAGAGTDSTTTYLAALNFGPNTWQTSSAVTVSNSTYLPTGLTSTYSTDLSTLWNSDPTVYTATANQNAVLANCETTLSGIVAPANWNWLVGPQSAYQMPGIGMTACIGTGSVGFTNLAIDTPTNSPTNTVVNTATNTATNTTTNTPTPTTTNTYCNTATSSPTSTPTLTATSTTTNTATSTATITATDNHIQLTATIVEGDVDGTATMVENNVAATSTMVENDVIATSTAVENEVASTATAVENKVATTATAVENEVAATATAVENDEVAAATAVNVKQAATSGAFALNENGTATEVAVKDTATQGEDLAKITETATILLSKPAATQTPETADEFAAATAVANSENLTATVVAANETATTGAFLLNASATATAEIANETATALAESNKEGATATAEIANETDTALAESNKETATATAEIAKETTTALAESNKETATATALIAKETATTTALSFKETTTETEIIIQESFTPTNTPTVTRTATNTHTPTVTRTPTNTPTSTGTDNIGSSLANSGIRTSSVHGNPVLAPIPVKSGTSLCLYNSGDVTTSTWQVINLMGEKVSEISFGGSSNECWNTQGVAPGLYIVEIAFTYIDGTKGSLTQKIVVSAP